MSNLRGYIFECYPDKTERIVMYCLYGFFAAVVLFADIVVLVAVIKKINEPSLYDVSPSVYSVACFLFIFTVVIGLFVFSVFKKIGFGLMKNICITK